MEDEVGAVRAGLFITSCLGRSQRRANKSRSAPSRVMGAILYSNRVLVMLSGADKLAEREFLSS
jgi:hypothetical protein